jgi:hypothetical protein
MLRPRIRCYPASCGAFRRHSFNDVASYRLVRLESAGLEPKEVGRRARFRKVGIS